MTKPPHHLVDVVGHIALRQYRPRNHDDRQSEDARSIEFRAGSLASSILGDDKRNIVFAQQRQIPFEAERAARNHGFSVRQRKRFPRRIDQAQQVTVVRTRSKCDEILPANREKDPGRGFGERFHGGIDAAHVVPRVARQGRPGRALERDVLHVALATGKESVPAHQGSEGMRGVDQVSDAFASEILDEPRNTTETSDPHGERLHGRSGRAAGIGEHTVHVCFRDSAGDLARLRRPAQQQDALHG